MDFSKLIKNPNSAKALLNKKTSNTDPRPVKKQERVFTEKQLDTIVSALVKQEVAKIPKAKDGKTPTREEVKAIILPLIPVVKDGKDGKNAAITPAQIDKIVTQVLGQVAQTPDLTDAIVKVFKEKKISADVIPGFTELKERVEKLADNQKWTNNRPSGGYTDTDVRRVITEDGGLGATLTVAELDGSPSVSATTLKFPNGTVTDNGDGSATYTPAGSGGDVTAASTFGTDNRLIRSDGVGKGVQSSGISIDDTDNVSGVGTLNSLNLPSSDFSGVSDAETLTNKTIDADNNTITNLAIGAEVTGTVENLSDVTITTIASGELLKWNGSAWINNTLAEAGIAAASHTHATSDITSGTFADARIAESNVTQHEAALTLTEAQVEAALSAATAFTAGNFVFNTDQTVGVGQDNYVLTYDNATGEIGLEASAGGGLANVVEDTTPELGGDLASNGNNIRMADANGIYLGTGNDLLMYHDGSDNQWVSSNGSILFDNTDATANYQFTLGADTSATAFIIRNNSNTELLRVDGDTNIDLAASADLTWNGTAILSDNAGTMTLSNVDALDATTEATIEAAIDTLSNLTTVGTLTSGNADAIVSAASTTTAGKVELATTAETDTGTDTGRAITPDGLAGSNFGERNVQIVVFDYGTATATGDGKAYFHIPSNMDGMDLVEVHAEVITAGTTGTTDIQIHNVDNALDMLSTKLTIDSAETGSDTAATAAVINTSNDHVNTNDVIRIDVDAVSTTPANGLIVTLTFRLP